MDNPATIKDVENRWGPISDENLKIRVETWIGDMWRKVKRVPLLTERLTAEALAEPDVEKRDLRAEVVRVIAECVIRVLKNPKGLWSFGIDDGTATMDRTLSTGELYISDEQWADLMPETMAAPTAHSIPLAVPYWGS